MKFCPHHLVRPTRCCGHATSRELPLIPPSLPGLSPTRRLTMQRMLFQCNAAKPQDKRAFQELAPRPRAAPSRLSEATPSEPSAASSLFERDCSKTNSPFERRHVKKTGIPIQTCPLNMRPIGRRHAPAPPRFAEKPLDRAPSATAIPWALAATGERTARKNDRSRPRHYAGDRRQTPQAAPRS